MQPLSRLATALAFTTAGLLSVTAHAEEPRYNQISLSTQVSHEVAHDLMQVTLFSEARERDPASLAAQLLDSGHSDHSHSMTVGALLLSPSPLTYWQELTQ